MPTFPAPSADLSPRWTTQGTPPWAWQLEVDGQRVGSVLARGRYTITYRATAHGRLLHRPGQDFATLEAAKQAVEQAVRL